MGFFITKKQKAQMRERRKKLLKLGGDKDNEQDGGESSKKRKLDIEAQNHDDEKDQSDEKDLTQPLVVTVPSNIEGKEVKKFRKDARRKARSEGRDENLIKFINQGEEAAELILPPPKRQKTSKKVYPRINDMLEEQKKMEKENKKEEARKQAEAKIPEEVKAQYLALDCEMVGIGSEGKQSALARVSLVNWRNEVIIDTFVKVPSRVTDFRTHVSGVTAKHLHADTAMELHACRKRVAGLLKDKILVGHALKNDLQALLLEHPKVDIRDTAKYRPFQRASGRNGGKWRPRKLRDLVKENVGKDIQVEGRAHDSTEDAAASMDLFKIVRNPWEKELKQASRKKK